MCVFYAEYFKRNHVHLEFKNGVLKKAKKKSAVPKKKVSS